MSVVRRYLVIEAEAADDAVSALAGPLLCRSVIVYATHPRRAAEMAGMGHALVCGLDKVDLSGGWYAPQENGRYKRDYSPSDRVRNAAVDAWRERSIDRAVESLRKSLDEEAS